jgi:hypothetical protein
VLLLEVVVVMVELLVWLRVVGVLLDGKVAQTILV